jgi:hypothetical protein
MNMKQVVRIILAAVAVAALAVPAMAAPGDLKLKVRDDGNTADVFSVDNLGTVIGSKLGMGTSTPQVPLHLNSGTAPVGTVLYNASTSLGLTRQDGSVAADFTVADGTATAGKRGSLRGVRARGTLAVPAVPVLDDQVFSVIGGVWTGTQVLNSADMTFKIDGTVGEPGGVATAPQRIVFSTRNGGAGAYIERLVIKNDGKIIIPTIPVFADNTAAASLATGTLYRTSTGVLMIKF